MKNTFISASALNSTAFALIDGTSMNLFPANLKTLLEGGAHNPDDLAELARRTTADALNATPSSFYRTWRPKPLQGL